MKKNPVNEPVKIVAYNPKWPLVYEREATTLKNALGRRIRGIEHVGSTAVPGLTAKPIVDILIGIQELKLSLATRKILAELDYEYVGRTWKRDRFYLRKRGKCSFNLAVVVFGSDLWTNGLALRAYFRRHPKGAKTYVRKKRAIL